MKTGGGLRCDSCGRFADALDEKLFKQFVMPPSVDRVTGLRDGKFPGIAMQSDPKRPVLLHACPPCVPKVKKTIKFTDPTFLPPGPLKKVLDRIKAQDRMRFLKLE